MKDKEMDPERIVCKNYFKTNEAFDFSSETIDMESIQMEEKLKTRNIEIDTNMDTRIAIIINP